jgi:hypothetical protein
MTATSDELAMIHKIRSAADDLSRMLKEAHMQGFSIQVSLNAMTGTCDQFHVFKMIPVDLKGAAN